jgi:hypothetical protein
MGEAHHPLTAARSGEWRAERTAFFVHGFGGARPTKGFCRFP